MSLMTQKYSNIEFVNPIDMESLRKVMIKVMKIMKKDYPGRAIEISPTNAMENLQRSLYQKN